MARIFFPGRVAIDPSTGDLVPVSVGQIFAVTDTDYANPLTVYDLAGVAMAQVSVLDGLTDEFGVDEPVDGDNSRFKVIWKSGTYAVLIESGEGTLQAAIDARDAAREARDEVKALAEDISNAPAILPAGGSQGDVLYRGTAERSGSWGPPSQGGGGASSWEQISGKPSTFPPSGHTHTAAQISNSTTVGRAVLTAEDAAAARAAIGAGTSNSTLALGSTGTTAAPGNHTHTASQVGFTPSGVLTATNVQDAIVQAAQSGGGAGTSAVYVWRYTSGAWPAMPSTAPAGVMLVEAIGPSQPTTLPGWVGLAANKIPLRYYQANVA